MKGLIKNELIKAYKTDFVRVMLIILIACCFIIPLGKYFLSSVTFGDYNSYDYNMSLADNASSKPEKVYYTTMAETDKFLDDSTGNVDHWKYDVYFGTLQALSMNRAVCTLAEEGFKKNEVENYFMYEDMLADIKLDDDMNIEYPDEDDKDVFSLKPDELKAKINELDSMIAKLKKAIAETGIIDYYKSQTDNTRAMLEQEKINLADYEKALAENPNNAVLQEERDNAAASVKSDEIMLWGQEYLLKNKCPYDSWQNNAVNHILSGIAGSYVFSVIKSESRFMSSEERQIYKTYEDYVKEMESRNAQLDEALSIAKYSLENNIPLPECSEDSVRDNFNSDALMMVKVAAVLMVFIAGTTLYNEYNSGSIRLLLIRPKSRSKILLSKLITVLIYGAAAIIFSMIVVLMLDFMLHKDRDMTVPYLIMSRGGEIKQIAPILFTSVKVLAETFSLLLIVILVFSVSAIFARCGILALALGVMMVNMNTITQALSIELNGHMRGILKYTVLPYADLSGYFGNSVANYSNGGESMLGVLFGTAMSHSEFSGVFGAALIAVHIAVFLVIAFRFFKKKEIKN